MNRKMGNVWGIVLIVLGILALIGRIGENTANGMPWYVVTGANDIAKTTSIVVNFMFWIGGIMLLIPFKQKSTAASLETDNTEYYVLPDAKPNKKNSICIIAFVFGVLSFLLPGIAKIILALITSVLSYVGLKQAYDNNESGTALGKWALTLGVSAILGVIYLAVISSGSLLSKDIDNKKAIYEDTEQKNIVKEDKKIEYSKGIVIGNSYESEFIGLKVDLPETWVMLTDEEIKEKYGAEYFDQYEMSAVNIQTNENIILMTEKLISKNITLEQEILSLENGLKASGMTVVSDQDEVVFCGQKYRNILMNMSYNGKTVISEYYLRKENDRVIGLIMTYLEGNRGKIDEILNSFSEYN